MFFYYHFLYEYNQILILHNFLIIGNVTLKRNKQLARRIGIMFSIILYTAAHHNLLMKGKRSTGKFIIIIIQIE